MKWQDLGRSRNVEDRRGARMPGGPVGGGIGVLIIVIIAYFAGVDPRPFLGGMDQGAGNGTAAAPAGAGVQDEMRDFVSAVLGSTEEVWGGLFQGAGQAYREPTLVLYTGSTSTSCGLGQAAMGPFYCPGDEKVYIDLSFYDDLRSRFGAPGDFAQAYVMAHEVGHHVQHLAGTSDQVHALRQRQSEQEANAMSVRLELQADCYAGIWAHHADRMRGVLETGDVDEALGAAAAVGDDRLQRQAGGMVVPESFTHGTSEQRARWFRRGLDTGDTRACDTFGAASL